MKLLERLLELPHATLLTWAAIALSLIGYISGDLSLDQAFITAGIGTAGAGALGIARNGAGRGVKK